MLSTSFALPPAERKALDQLKARTGVAKTTIICRLLAFYAGGGAVPGLPPVVPPIVNPITKALK